jgi:CheY-like chemotaxis protein
MKVLLVDDDEFILDMYERVFLLEKHEVSKAHDGAEALAFLDNAKTLPDVMILDINMPHVDGYGVLKAIQGKPKLAKLPVIVLSNLYKMDQQQKAVDLGARMFLVKSQHEPKEVLTIVNQILKP